MANRLNKFEQFYKRLEELVGDIDSFMENQQKKAVKINDDFQLRILGHQDGHIDIAEYTSNGREATFRLVVDLEDKKMMPRIYQPSKEAPIQNAIINNGETINEEVEHENSKIMRKWFADLRKLGIFGKPGITNKASFSKQAKKEDNSLDQEGLKYGEHIGYSKYDIRNNILTVEDINKKIDEMSQDEMELNVKKKNVLPPLNLKNEIEEEGVPPGFAYFVKKLRDRISNAPKKKTRENCKAYILGLKEFQSAYDRIKHDLTLKENGTVDARVEMGRVYDTLFYDIQNKIFKETGSDIFRAFGNNYSSNFKYNFMKFTREGESKYHDGSLFYNASHQPQVNIACLSKYDKENENYEYEYIIVYEQKNRMRDRTQLFEEKFSSRQKARDFLENNQAEVENKITQYKKRLDRPVLEHINRDGQDYREGRDISPNELMETFGLRAVEYGKWNSQPKVKQEYTNHAFDAFADLANTLDIPFKSVGLNNTLAIAFGARGAGKAAAHFEPSLKVINMTKIKGAGSLAHEWGHALDYHLGNGRDAASERQNAHPYSVAESELHSLMHNSIVNTQKLKTDEDKEGQLRTCKRQVDLLFDSLKHSLKYSLKIGFSEDQLEDLIQVRKNMFFEGVRKGDHEILYKADALLAQDFVDISRLRKTPEEMKSLSYWAQKGVETQKELHSSEQTFRKTRTDFAQNAAKLDGNRSKKYYTKYVELFARSFEAYVEDKLEANGCWSPYLVQGTKNKDYVSVFNKIPVYPDGEEREEINTGFDKFLSELRQNPDFEKKQKEDAEEVAGPGM